MGAGAESADSLGAAGVTQLFVGTAALGLLVAVLEGALDEAAAFGVPEAAVEEVVAVGVLATPGAAVGAGVPVEAAAGPGTMGVQAADG